MEKQYTCDKCKYTCFFESLYMRHLRTRKHMRNKNDNNNNDKNDNDNENDNIRFSNNEIMVRLINTYKLFIDSYTCSRLPSDAAIEPESSMMKNR